MCRTKHDCIYLQKGAGWRGVLTPAGGEKRSAERKQKKKRERTGEKKGRARTMQLKDASSLYFLSLVQISALERVSGNKSADEHACE